MSAVLNIPDTEIKTTIMLNTNLKLIHEDEKQGILDVRLTLNNNTEIDIEMQLSYLKSWANRSVFYLSKMLAEQVGIDRRYSNMKKCIGINILDFNYIKGTDRFHTSYNILENIELPKLPANTDGTSLYDWAKFINTEDREGFSDACKEKCISR